LDGCKYLIEKGANAIIALDSSILNNRVNVVQYLITNGADINYALHTSLGHGCLSVDVTKYLINNGANIHANDEYALRVCAKNDLLDIVKYLIANGADIHAGNESALSISIMRSHLYIIKYLIEEKYVNKYMILLLSIEYNKLDILKYLVRKGININANTNEALCHSIKYGNGDIIKYIAKQSINSGRIITIIYNRTKLSFKTKAKQIIEYLIKYSDKITITDNRRKNLTFTIIDNVDDTNGDTINDNVGDNAGDN
jgi:ankyrin repeat protein